MNAKPHISRAKAMLRSADCDAETNDFIEYPLNALARPKKVKFTVALCEMDYLHFVPNGGF